MILPSIGKFLVVDDSPIGSEAVIVLNTGMEYYPRLIEAAEIYNNGYAKKIVINGNRKTEALRNLEKKGLVHCCLWYEERIRILELYNVQRDDVITISAEDVYDTISESKAVGEELLKRGITKILLVTSKSHTKRAKHIWQNAWDGKLEIQMVSAKEDPYDTEGWWKSGRQIKWVLSEYGAWMYYYWHRFID
ncbi:YdcF family protein [Thermodesulfobacteriota bacterium]